MCDDAVTRFRAGEQITAQPMVMLDIPLKRPPLSDRVHLAGRHGPLGRICVVSQDGEAFRGVGYFPAIGVKAFALAAIKARSA